MNSIVTASEITLHLKVIDCIKRMLAFKPAHPE